MIGYRWIGRDKRCVICSVGSAAVVAGAVWGECVLCAGRTDARLNGL